MTTIPVPSLHTTVVLPDSHPEDFEGLGHAKNVIAAAWDEYWQQQRDGQHDEAA